MSEDPHAVTQTAKVTVNGETAFRGFHSDPAAALPDEIVVQPVRAMETLQTFTGPARITAASGVPDVWCGPDPGELAPGTATPDDVTNAVYSQDTEVFKVIYAYAADQPSRFDVFKDRLQATASLLRRYMAYQSGGKKTLRFDMGTSCGPEYLDIQVVALPKTRAEYVVGGVPRFGTVTADVRAAIGSPRLPRNYVIYADRLRGTNGVAGTGEFYYGEVAERPDSPWHNYGDLMSVVWGPSALSSSRYAEPATMMHEMGHNMGAVQASAPNSSGVNASNTPLGHCNDEQDLMCYADGGSRGRPEDMQYKCPYIRGQVTETFDCGGDDYFNPDPVPGSYLESAWNTYNSAMLVECDTLPDGCDAIIEEEDLSPEPPAPDPPTNATPTAGDRWYAGSYTVTMTGGVGATRFQWRVNSGPVTESRHVLVSGDGVHTLHTRVGDNAENFSPWRGEIVRVDGTAPQVTVTCPTMWVMNAADCQVNAQDNRGVAVIEVNGPDGAVQTFHGVPGTRLSVRGDGALPVQARAQDHAGNWSAWAFARAHVDLYDPMVSVSCTAAGDGVHQCTASASDTGSGIRQVTWQPSGGLPTAVTGPFTVTGPASITVHAEDHAGRTASTTVNVRGPAVRDPGGEPQNPTARKTGRVRGKARGTFTVSWTAAAGRRGKVTVATKNVRAGRGRYRVRVCASAGRRQLCSTRNVRLRRTGRLPAVRKTATVAAPSRASVIVFRRHGRRWKVVGRGNVRVP